MGLQRVSFGINVSKMFIFEVFTFLRKIGDYFQWKICFHLQKLRGWTKLYHSKFTTSTKITLVALFHCFFRKKASKMLILGGFSCYKRTISGNFDLTVCEIFKKKKKKIVRKIQSSRIFLIFQKQTFREVKKITILKSLENSLKNVR